MAESDRGRFSKCADQRTVVDFDNLPGCDLIAGAFYQGGPDMLVSSDPLCRMFPCGNQGGIRQVRRGGDVCCVVLFSRQNDQEMADTVDRASRLARFHGDNRVSGRDLFGNKKGGNRLLAGAFADVYSSPPNRQAVPPFFLFTNAPDVGCRAVHFHGLAVPGGKGISAKKASKNDQISSSYGKFFQLSRSLYPLGDFSHTTPVVGWRNGRGRDGR